MRLILVRHAQTDNNRDGFAQGRADTPLNDAGHAQTRTLAEALAGEPLTAIITSPLVRARATAEAIAAKHPHLALREEPGLVEMDIGAMEGLGFAELREQHPGFLRAWTSAEAGRVPMPGGESLEQVQERSWRVIERMLAEHGAGVVAAVSHNFTIMTLLCRAMDIDLADFRRVRQDVGAYSVVDLMPTRTVVRKLNDTCHLNDGRLPEPRSPFRQRPAAR